MRALLVRPWIHDFSTYDLWIQPLGLLYLAAVLEQNEIDVDYLDCLANRYEIKKDGRAKFHKQVISRPESLRSVNRYYGRFGITLEQFHETIQNLSTPDVILVTSGMTYWYPGVQETIRYLRGAFPAAPIILGGIYATLMTDHARQYAGADSVVAGEFEQQIIPFLLNQPPKFPMKSLHDYPEPAWHLTHEQSYRVIMTSRGCPYRCTFCASDLLNEKKFVQRRTEDILAEIERFFFEDGVRHLVFYDDALLIHHRKHFDPLLRKIIERGLHFQLHAPNGLNAREIDAELAELMYASSFQTIRLALESVSPEIQKVQGNNKVNNTMFENAVVNLYRAGYGEGDLECYLIQGLPGQTVEDVRSSLKFVSNLGVIARLATFSPIPGTAEAEAARKEIGDDFLREPLLQNHSVFPLRNKAMTAQELQEIKHECNAYNETIRKNAERSSAGVEV
jgi:radical SAM superfamily enzyme YgiQ (UPF0313 family)